MIKECNFKQVLKTKDKPHCRIAPYLVMECKHEYSTGIIKKEIKTLSDYLKLMSKCSGEENCILFQIYKSLNNSSDGFYMIESSDGKKYYKQEMIRSND